MRVSRHQRCSRLTLSCSGGQGVATSVHNPGAQSLGCGPLWFKRLGLLVAAEGEASGADVVPAVPGVNGSMHWRDSADSSGNWSSPAALIARSTSLSAHSRGNSGAKSPRHHLCRQL